MDNILELKDVTVDFGGRIILNHIKFSFHQGIYVISGQSGIGKSTLLNAISGYLDNVQGDIFYDKNSVIGYCLQEDMFFSNLTVEDNLKIKHCAVSENEMFEKAEILNLLDKFNISSLITSKLSTLSGGEKQRLKMAMMLIDNPNIILLDEPTSMLDENNKENLIKEIENLWKEKLLIIASHDNLNFSHKVTNLKLEGGLLYEV